MNDPFRFALKAHGQKPPSDLIGRSMKLKRAAYDSRGDSRTALLHIADYLQGLAGAVLPPTGAA